MSSASNSAATTPSGGPPPLPATKPVLTSSGSYGFTSSSAGGVGAVAGIHSVNKQHSVGPGEKPAIAARPIPPPTLPKYTSSFGKIDRTEREKLQSKREMFFKSEGQNHTNNNNNTSNNISTPATNNGHNNHHHVTTHNNHTSSTTITQITTSSTNNSGDKVDGGNNVTIGVKAQAPAAPVAQATNGHLTSNGSAATNHSVNNLASNLAGMSVKGGIPATTATPSLVAATAKMMDSHMNNGHVDSNKMAAAADRHVEKMDHEKYQHPVVRAKPKELDGYVGFANLPNQVYRKAVKRGFDFTLMVVGESGLGKSTLINTMFLSDIYNNDQHPGPSQRAKKTVAVETTKVLLKENSVNLSLTIVDTPGFGDAVDNSNCWVPVIDFIENKYEEYLTAESRVQRKAITDSRVHCCLYFIAPSGHGLKPLDVEFMQRLCDKVNIIPVIAKADTMTPEEVQLFKKQILNEIAQHKIKIYDFPEPLENEEEAKVLRALRQRVPFAVVGANTVIEVDGKKVRGRRYPWGVAEVENLDHCDFIALRNMVIRTHLHDLKDVTNHVHYENYRCRKLAGLGNDGKGRMSNKNPLAQMEEEKKEHELKMKKMEAEMEQVFEMKVKEKKQKLKDSEVEMSRRHEDRKKQLEVQIRELEERRRAFDQEKKEWEDQHGVTLDELKRRSLEANSKEYVSSKNKK